MAEHTCDWYMCDKPVAYTVTGFYPELDLHAEHHVCIECAEVAELYLHQHRALNVERTPVLDSPEGQGANVVDNLCDAVRDLWADTEIGEPCSPEERGRRHLEAFLASLPNLAEHLLTHGRAAEAIHQAEVWVDATEPQEVGVQ